METRNVLIWILYNQSARSYDIINTINLLISFLLINEVFYYMVLDL